MINARETAPAATDVTMLWMEGTRVGSAARTHMDGTATRLAAEGIGVRERISSEASGGGILGKVRRLLSLVVRARRAAHPGVLVARWHPFLAFVAPAWFRRGGRVLLLVQGNDASSYEMNPWLRKIPGIRALMTRSLAGASSILCVNRGLLEWVQQERAAAPPVPIDVMPSGVSDLFFDADPVDIGEPYVLFFGGLAPWQGIDYMLEARRSATWPEGLKLLVIGDGEKAQAVRDAEGPGVSWLGPKAPAELAGYVAGALVTLCPKSASDSMAKTTTPFKVLESVAAGVPVIATDIPAQVDMLSEGYGILVDVDDPEDLARAVARIATEPDVRAELVQTARAYAPRCRWTYAAPQLADAIRSLQTQIAR